MLLAVLSVGLQTCTLDFMIEIGHVISLSLDIHVVLILTRFISPLIP